MSQEVKKGVLLVNLGSPKSTETKDVKEYLDEFLMDPKVIDAPKWLRTLLVRGIILNTRPKKSAAAYRKIWWEEGSPLIVISKRLKEKVQKLVDVPVALAMRYSEPSIYTGLKELADKGVNQIRVLPLYPQHAMSTTETVMDKVYEEIEKHFPNIKVDSIKPFYNNEDYIKVLSKSIDEEFDVDEMDYLLFSYHGIPERHLKKTDPTKSHCQVNDCCQRDNPEAHAFCYRHQCFKTTELVAKKLNLPKEKYGVSFQSRLGPDPWLKPFTDKTIEQMAKDGTKKLAVVMPAFVSDCLETLEEIGMEAEEEFLHNGGEKFKAIPCINDRDDWAELVASWVTKS